jgi:hypothetical protein
MIMIMKIIEILLYLLIGKLLNFNDINKDISINIININVDQDFKINDLLPDINYLSELLTKEDIELKNNCYNLIERNDISINPEYLDLCQKFI